MISFFRSWPYSEVTVRNSDKWGKGDILKLKISLVCNGHPDERGDELIWTDAISRRKFYSPSCCKRYQTHQKNHLKILSRGNFFPLFFDLFRIPVCILLFWCLFSDISVQSQGVLCAAEYFKKNTKCMTFLVEKRV